MNSLGFTGTRKGMTEAQRAQVIKFLHDNLPYEVHHGDCMGADEEFATIVWLQFRSINVISHPPLDGKYRAYSQCNLKMDPKPYLERDADIVKVSNHLLACPKQAVRPNSLRGEGTWWTIDYAESKSIPVTIILPDGSIT